MHQTAGGELPSVQVGNSEDDISRSPPGHHCYMPRPGVDRWEYLDDSSHLIISLVHLHRFSLLVSDEIMMQSSMIVSE